jgi:hypothetical protein
MINTLVRNNNKILTVEKVFNDIYLLPKWEKIKSFSFTKRLMMFKTRSLDVNLFRKFSSKNLLEKYSLRTTNDKILANMDLKIYKDSVYIINLNIQAGMEFEQALSKLLQVAIEKALYNTTEKEVIINLTSGIITKNKIKKVLLNNEFVAEENQSSYEKEMFGESFSIKVDNTSNWYKKIKQMPILINK